MARTYPSYKPSGIDWLGNIPAHWGLGRLKFSANARTSNVDKHTKDNELPVKLCNYVDVYKNEFIMSDMDFMSASATEAEIERFALKRGDVLITKDSEAWNDIAVPALVADDLEDVLCGYHLAIIRSLPGVFNAGYLFRLFCSEMVNYQFKIAANGVTRFGLPTYALNNATLLHPPLEEQAAISDYIDGETAQLDALIACKRKLLKLLEEKRLALITHAVTHGLDSRVPMKDSGIEWLRRIPAHWDAFALGRCVMRIEQGWSPSCEERQVNEDEWGVLKSGCVNGGVFRPSNHKTLPATLEPKPHLEVKTGDLLMCRASGSLDLIGSVALVDTCPARLMFSDKTYRLRLNPDLADTSFVMMAMASKYMRDQIRLSVSGADGLANNIPQSLVRKYAFACPPVAEQIKIAHFLRQQISNINKIERNTFRSINILLEFRSALITNAVIGKIDVRKYAQKEAAA